MNTDAENPQVVASQNPEPEFSMDDFKKILVAVDYVAATPQIFEQAMRLAKTHRSHLMVFHGTQERIIDMLPGLGLGAYSGVYSQEMIELEAQLEKENEEELRAWLGSFVQRATNEGIVAEFNYKSGDPGQQICALAKAWEADLIIIGRRGRRGLSELLLGSVSNYVIHHAHCSVLVVQR